MIKALIIDDEASVRNDLKQKVQNYFDRQIEIAAEAASVAEALLAIDIHKPDLLLLDIHLPDGSGFDLIEKSLYKDFEVIFITGFDTHAIKAIKVGALDYILKPVDPDELREAIEKVVKTSDKTQYIEKLIEVTNDYFKGVEKKRVILKTSETIYAVYEDEILYCKSDGNYTTFYTVDMERILVSKPIKKMMEILSEDSFVRCHQSYAVNKKHVVKYNKQGNLIIHGDTKVPVSGRRKDHVMQRIFGTL